MTMTCGKGGWWCVAMVLLCLAATAQSLPSEKEEVPWAQHRSWLRGLNFDHSIAKNGVGPKLQQLRKVLAMDSSLCGWKNDACTPQIAEHAPDERIITMSNSVVTCENITTKDACLEDQHCFWLNACTTDLLHDVRDCLVPEYLTVRRAGLCPIIVRKSDCTVLAGCEWDSVDEKCVTDSRALLEALRSNDDVSKAYSTNAICAGSDPCAQPCTDFPNAGCLFQRASDISQWFKPTATSPFCRSIQETVRCQWMEGPASCTGTCKAGDGGCTVSKAAIVDILYEDKPALLNRMQKAVKSCPSMKLQKECEAFDG